jgi:hypothetical protein
MIDTFFSWLPTAVAIGLIYSGLSLYRVALRIRSEPKQRRTGLLLNLARRLVPPGVTSACLVIVALLTDRLEVLWLAGVVLAAGAAWGLTRMLQEMRATTARVTLARLLFALALTLVGVYLWQLP